jgi:mono/diheme cytochrome c family protein
MGRVSRLFTSGVVLAVAMLIAAFTVQAQTRGAAAPAARTMKNPVASTPASITAGAAAYKKYCAFCHGVTGKGDGPLAPKDAKPADLTDAKWDHGATDGDIFNLIQNGGGANSKMVAFKGKMPDQDMWHIVNFIRSLGPKDAPR